MFLLCNVIYIKQLINYLAVQSLDIELPDEGYPRKVSCALNSISTFLLQFIAHVYLCFNSCMILKFLQQEQYHCIVIVVFHVVLHFFLFRKNVVSANFNNVSGSAQLTVNLSSECQFEKKTLHQQFCDDHFGMYKTSVYVLSFFVVNDGLCSMWFIKDKYISFLVLRVICAEYML